jgi:hypothetical protein
MIEKINNSMKYSIAEFVANSSIVLVILFDLRLIDIGSFFRVETYSIPGLLLMNMAVFSIGGIASRPFINIMKQNQERSSQKGRFLYHPAVMPIVYFLNGAVLAYTLATYKGFPVLSFVVSNLIFLLFGVFMTGEVQIAGAQNHKRQYLRLSKLFEDSIGTFVPAVIVLYCLLIPIDYYLNSAGSFLAGNEAQLVTLRILLLVVSCLAFVGLAKVLPISFPLEKKGKVAQVAVEIVFWIVMTLGFSTFDSLVGQLFVTFGISGPLKLLPLILLGVIPFRVFDILYGNSKNWQRYVGLIILLGYYIFKYFVVS